MFRENWKAWQFWRWWWHDRVPTDAKVAVAITLALGLLTGGYFASGHLTGASAATSADSYVLQSTITKVVTVKEHGRTVVKRYPVVVRRSVIRSHTSFATVVDTRVVTTPGGVRYVTKREVKYVPVVRKRTVRVNGKTTTLTETRLVPTVQTQTLTNVVTNQQTVTNESTVVVNRTNTLTVPVTNNVTTTVTLPPDTVTSVQTVTDTVTVTLPVTTTVFVTT